MDRLVAAGIRHYGQFAAPPLEVNPLDEFAGLSRVLHRARFKQWVGFALIHPEWHLAFIMQDAQYLATATLYAYDRRRGVMHEHSGVRRGGSLHMPAHLVESRCAFESRGFSMSFDFAQSLGRHRLRFDLPKLRGVIELDAQRASMPLAISGRLVHGGSMYTHKAIFPAAGALRIGDDDVLFDGARDLAILDEQQSFFPYFTRWQWGTFAMFTPDGLVGANFADHRMLDGDPEESCLWTPGRCEPLSDLRFGQASADPLSPWHISSRDGRLDVTFEPEARKQEQRQFGVAAIDYFQLAGHYSGVLRTERGAVDVRRVRGVCERMRARF